MTVYIVDKFNFSSLDPVKVSMLWVVRKVHPDFMKSFLNTYSFISSIESEAVAKILKDVFKIRVDNVKRKLRIYSGDTVFVVEFIVEDKNNIGELLRAYRENKYVIYRIDFYD